MLLEEAGAEMTLNDWATLLGIIFASVGLILGVLNYFRDRPRVIVELQWDMSVTGDGPYDPGKKWGVVTVANSGRRPVFVSHAQLTTYPRWARGMPSFLRKLLSRVPKKLLPERFTVPLIFLREGIEGKTLPEGGPPILVMVNQDMMNDYARHWNYIRAVIIDIAGKRYYSERTESDRPSWAMAD